MFSWLGRVFFSKTNQEKMKSFFFWNEVCSSGSHREAIGQAANRQAETWASRRLERRHLVVVPRRRVAAAADRARLVQLELDVEDALVVLAVAQTHRKAPAAVPRPALQLDAVVDLEPTSSETLSKYDDVAHFGTALVGQLVRRSAESSPITINDDDKKKERGKG